MTIETLDDLDDLLAEVEKKGFRARFLDPFADDPTVYHYLPAPDKDGVREHETVTLLEKINKVAKVRKWTDVCIVDQALEPLTGNHVAHSPVTPGTQVNNGHLSVDDILLTARTGIPASELPRAPYAPPDEHDPFDELCEQVAQETGVSLVRLRRIAIQEDLDAVENMREALLEVAEGMRANSG